MRRLKETITWLGFVGRMYEEEYTGVTLTDALIKGLEIDCSGKYKNVVTGRYTVILKLHICSESQCIITEGQTVLNEIDDFTAF